MGACANGGDVSITLGVEEELFLIDPESRALLANPDERIFEDCDRNKGPHKVVREFLRSQIETNTRVCASVAELREALLETRRIVVEAARKRGAAVAAVSLHPFSSWREQMVTQRERYENFATIFQESVRRFVIGGMHVHAGFGDADTRVRVMTALRRHLPLMHALSASSPFNSGQETGFKSYRLNLVGNLPRTGIPSPLYDEAEYNALVEQFQRANFIGNGSELWWDIRPSHSYPTVEMRICDICTRVEDAVSIAALYACLIRRLSRAHRGGELPPEPLTEIIAEDRWLAQRYGVLAFFGDSGGGRRDIIDYLEELLDELAEDADALDCATELQRTLRIVREGTGADRQMDLYRLRLLEGDTREQALRQVVDSLIEETREGL